MDKFHMEFLRRVPDWPLRSTAFRLSEHKTFPIELVLKRDSTDLGAGPSKVESPYPVFIRTFLKPAAGSSEQREKTAERPSY